MKYTLYYCLAAAPITIIIVCGGTNSIVHGTRHKFSCILNSIV